jgi:hypothetical protein
MESGSRWISNQIPGWQLKNPNGKKKLKLVQDWFEGVLGFRARLSALKRGKPIKNGQTDIRNSLYLEAVAA